ncbi:hypothetical protein [Streptomyces otsuchiensis]|uniref:hypothetical protein n=1 Tax=Streptomyces otsuchiensis TaxID=2681388 RepID=UPI00102F30A2|nr:hypothetical protein [Streptomyces otsuchiensis]
MLRNVLGAVLAVIGAALALISPFRDWYGDTVGRDVRLQELFSGSGLTGARADLFAGIFLVMLVAAVVAVAGVLLRSRLMVALAGVLVLGITVLWMVRQYQVADTLVIGDNGFKIGTVGALIGGGLLLLGSALMAGRHPAAVHGRHRGTDRADRRVDRDDDHDAVEDGPYDHHPRASHDPYAPGRTVDPNDPRHPGGPDDARYGDDAGYGDEPRYDQPRDARDPRSPGAPGDGRGRVVDGPWDNGKRGGWDDARRRDEGDTGREGGRDAA